MHLHNTVFRHVPLASLRTALVAASLLALASAQEVGPGISNGPAPSPVFDVCLPPFSGMGVGGCVTQILQISMTKPGGCGLIPGKWLCALTISGLNGTYGGGGGASRSVVLGTYDILLKSFVPTTQANALNSADDDTFLMIEPKWGLQAVFERGPGTNPGPHFSTRLTCGAAFGPPVAITGLGGLVNIDPALGYVNGVLNLFYRNLDHIWRIEINAGTGAVSGLAVPVQTALLGSNLHSPTPIVHPLTNEVEGLFLAKHEGGDSDMYFADDLDPTTAIMTKVAGPGQQNNGGICGGEFHWASSSTAYSKTIDARGAWLIGDRVTPGNWATIFGGTYNYSPGMLNPSTTFLFGSLSLGVEMQFGGIFGCTALTNPPVFPLCTMVHGDRWQEAICNLFIPSNFPTIEVIVQGISLSQGVWTFTNTTRLWID